MSANGMQVGGGHYAAELQHWDFAAEAFGPGYFKGQITKYVYRWRKKNGTQDLKKALHFLEKMTEIDWVSTGWALRPSDRIPLLNEFLGQSVEGLAERQIILLVSEAANNSQLRQARAALVTLIALAEEEGGATSAYVNQG